MLARIFNTWVESLQTNYFEMGCRDREAGLLPKYQDSLYLRGYLSHRAEGLDGEIQFFSSLEDYLQWKMRSPFP